MMTGKGYVLLGLAALALIFIYTPVQAQSRPIQLSLFTPAQIFHESNPISGIRLNLIYGRNVSVTGLDVGLINHTTTGHSKGVQWGLISVADSDFTGWHNSFVGVTKGDFKGVQWGIVSVVNSNFTGWQDSWVGVTKGDFEGFQSGLVNYANNMSGFQLGLVNYTETMNGLQVGLVNIIRQGGTFPVFPIVNWSF
jgi:hypothetical protein